MALTRIRSDGIASGTVGKKQLDVVSATGTGAVTLPSGTTAQRGSPTVPSLRYNATLNKGELFDGSLWGPLGGGATGAAGDDVFYENGTTINASYTITAGKNAISAGPLAIASTATVTIPASSNWVIV